MNWPDFTKRSNAIVILLGSEIFFFIAMFAAYVMPHAPDDLRKICATAFTGATGMLALALKLGGPDVPNPPDATSGSTTTTTTATATSTASPPDPIPPKP
jgi:heme/copper-type cytochrome/quinol oxidase subunit 3